MDFLVARDDLHRVRFDDADPLEPDDGQAVLAVDAFGLTSNNITYAKFGDAMSYWSFFPAPEGWGRVPMWGFATVVRSRHEQLAEGTRVYGYLPPSSELLVVPAGASARGFVDASAHRAELPAAYNAYAATAADAVYDADTEDAQMLLRPLFFTSYLLDDFLADADMFGAGVVVLSSASSKTASALAWLLSERGDVDVVGLSSPRGAAFARELGVYDHVIGYDELADLPAGRAVYVDIAGDADVRAGVHGHYGDQLVHSAVVGATHHDRLGELPPSLPGAHPTFFFAPARVAQRSADWGREGLESRIAEAWRPYVAWADGWLQVEHASGAAALEQAYLALLEGDIEPRSAHVLTLAG